MRTRVRCRTVCPPSRSGSITSSSDSLSGFCLNGRSQSFFTDDELGKRKDTLPSPHTSPVPWLNDSLPHIVVARHASETGGTWSPSDGSDTSNYLTVPRRQDLGAYIISVTMKTPLCIQAKMCATNGGATAQSLDNRG
ncbi:hypothetical protein LSAT2_000358 [Lamellibrachia satsuma]|nr:hypothetical protein LSAT2_000358 [Lamellibrachia satsuma]